MPEAPRLLGNQKVLWALDAFAEEPEIEIKAARASRSFLQRVAGSIVPVYVARPYSPGLLMPAPIGLDDSGVQVAKQRLLKIVKQLALPAIEEPRLLLAEAPSIGSLVKALLEYAEEGLFDLIVVSTHGRTGVSRFFMGSFAEHLISHSQIPVLVTSAKTNLERTKGVKHLLFPTDFTDEAKAAFAEVVALAKGTGSDVMLFHQLVLQYPESALPFVVPPAPVNPIDEIIAAAEEEGREGIEAARAEGVKARFHLGTRLGDIPSAIVRAAAKLPSSIICMPHHTGTLEAFRLRSVSRQVIRTASCPVYLVRPPAKDEKKVAGGDWLTRGRAVLG